MLIGVPKEIKNHEYRVGLTPAGARELIEQKHQVIIETKAGSGIGITDEAYAAVGAEIVAEAAEVFQRADMVIKVKEPQPTECSMLRKGQILFTYLHLAPDPVQTELLVASGATAIAYETITSPNGGLPLLAPMSEVAGRMAVQAGTHCLEKAQGGNGMLLGGVPGVAPAQVTVIGGGVVGLNAARMALGLGADVTVIDKSLERLKHIDDTFHSRIKTLYSNTETLESQLAQSDLTIGAVLVPGAAAPKLVTRDMLRTMKAGAVLVDVAIDQGGCFETSKATTHAEPTFEVDGIVHYCVANMPGGVARTSTFALTNATLPYAIRIANNGLDALRNDPHLLAGLNVHLGKVTNKPVCDALGYTYYEASSVLA